jgi:hypothetical protein
LNEKDSEFIRGFDWCVEMAMDNFFNNIEDFFSNDSYVMHTLNTEIPEVDHEKYEWSNSFIEEDTEIRIVKTYLDSLRAHMINWVEDHRDELITSMIDGMDEDEYKRIKDRVDNGGDPE